MLLRERLDLHTGRLSPADLAVVEVLLSHPRQAALLPAEQVAERAGVHVAAATRLAQKLGYTGYPQLRTDLQSELLSALDAEDRMRATLERTDDDLLTGVVQGEIRSLRDLLGVLDQHEIDRSAERVLAARKLFLFARGNAAPLAATLARRLRRFGLDVAELTGSERDLAEELVAMTGDDLLVVLAFRRPPRVLPALVQTAAEAGTPLVLITDVLPAPTGATTLAGPRGDGREFQSLTVPMAIVNALVLSIARHDPARTSAALARLDTLLDRFDT